MSNRNRSHQLNLDDIARLHREMDPAVFRAEYMGDFVTTGPPGEEKEFADVRATILAYRTEKNRNHEPPRTRRLCTHPDNIARLFELYERLNGPDSLKGTRHATCRAFGGFQLIASPNMPRWAPKWKPPQDRFWMYGPGDESWCRYFGIGTYDPSDRPLFLEFIEPPLPPFLRYE
jgi:hypothetical protein